MARRTPTLLRQDWSEAADPASLPADTRHTPAKNPLAHDPARGALYFAASIRPVYAWYDGSLQVSAPGEKMDPSQITLLLGPRISQRTRRAVLAPFKALRIKQPYDVAQKILLAPRLWGPPGDQDAFWNGYDWHHALTAGMRALGMMFSGTLGFAPTLSLRPLHHQIAPASDALDCTDCHGNSLRIDWPALGYRRDPWIPPDRPSGSPKKR
jgi:hypothetical protein